MVFICHVTRLLKPLMMACVGATGRIHLGRIQGRSLFLGTMVVALKCDDITVLLNEKKELKMSIRSPAHLRMDVFWSSSLLCVNSALCRLCLAFSP